ASRRLQALSAVGQRRRNGGAQTWSGTRSDRRPPACVVVHPEHYPFGLECFHGLGGEYYGVEDQSKWPGSDLGREVVANAGDGAGDQLIFLAPGDPAVYWWKHDERVPPIRMASSFTELLRLIRPLFEE